MADAKKPEDKKDPWLNWLALTTVIFAVCATLSTFKGGGYSTPSVISQAQASDQWAYYQAKSIKANLYQIQRERLQLEFDTLPADAAPSKRSGYQAKLGEDSAQGSLLPESKLARVAAWQAEGRPVLVHGPTCVE